MLDLFGRVRPPPPDIDIPNHMRARLTDPHSGNYLRTASLAQGIEAMLDQPALVVPDMCDDGSRLRTLVLGPDRCGRQGRRWVQAPSQ